VVYTSASLSLAALELFVNLEPEELPEDLVAIGAGLPDDLRIETMEAAKLPHGWQRAPAPASLQALGAEWVRKGISAVLGVPSAVIPSERNYVLNPAHRDFRRIEIGKPEAFRFDPRMWK
jgi:RES domain-containing protein